MCNTSRMRSQNLLHKIKTTYSFLHVFTFIACISSKVLCLDTVDDEITTLKTNWTAQFCRDPGRIKHGQRIPDFKQGQIFQYQQELHFTCTPGYKLIQGVEKLTCGLNGQWEPLPKQRCRPVFCPRPSIPHGSALTRDIVLRPSANLEVQCNEGYRLQNKFVNRLECNLDGIWTGHNGEFTQELPECVELTCPPLSEMPNSIIEYKGDKGWDHGYREGSKAKYVCRQGYQMAGLGNGESMCLNGTWAGHFLIYCEIRGCNPPEKIHNGNVRVSNRDADPKFPVPYPIGTSVIYFCNPGYLMMGSSDGYKCMQDGKWSPHPLPVCQKIFDVSKQVKCPQPPVIMFGYLEDASEDYILHSTVTYACHVGFHLIGDAQLTCNVDGHWFPPMPPTCELILDKKYFGTDWDGIEEVPDPPEEKSSTQDISSKNWDSLGAQAISFLTAGCVMGILFLVLISAVIAQRHGCGKWCQMQLRPSSSRDVLPHEPALCQDQDRAALIAFADGVQVALPTYEEATSNQYSTDFIYNGTTLLPRPGGFSASRHNRYVLHRPNGNHDHNNGGLGGPNRHSASTHSAYGRSSSLAESLGSTDTVTPSEVSTTVTVDTLSSTLSQATSSTNSTRAFCGSLTSFDTAGSGSILNIEGVPLLEESESEKLSSSTELQEQQRGNEETV